MNGRATVAFATALLACLAIGLWYGGHPGKLPSFLRDAFVGGEAGLTVEATEEIEDEQRAAGCVIGEDYPAPVVDHKHERERAMERYGAVRR